MIRSRHHAWHPYTGLPAKPAPLPVIATQGHYLHLASGERLLDGIASWWTSIFGYNHPALVDAIQQQSKTLSHVMFGGLTHPAAEQLANTLADLSPATPAVFLSDSGSVAVEIALKMARQYWQAQGKPNKNRFLALKQGYHGDTWGAMSVSDPDNLHQQFRDASQTTLFAQAPQAGFDRHHTDEADVAHLKALVERHHTVIAAIILEPIWQGAGAMNFYRPAYLKAVRQLCDQYQLLLICDEIATGFGKTGRLFAHEHANITPDILCLGKALTGGMMTLAATCASQEIADQISQHAPHRFMHGPTYMANALACASANASLRLLHQIDWSSKVNQWQTEMLTALTPLCTLAHVQDVRVLGHVGVIEMIAPTLAAAVQPLALAAGIWLRPFGAWVYLTPAYTMSAEERHQLLQTTVDIIERVSEQQAYTLSEAI